MSFQKYVHLVSSKYDFPEEDIGTDAPLEDDQPDDPSQAHEAHKHEKVEIQPEGLAQVLRFIVCIDLCTSFRWIYTADIACRASAWLTLLDPTVIEGHLRVVVVHETAAWIVETGGGEVLSDIAKIILVVLTFFKHFVVEKSQMTSLATCEHLHE